MNTQLIKTIPVFATRESIDDATSYGMSIAHSMGDADKCAMITGLMVLYNTMATEINALRLDKEQTFSDSQRGNV